MAAPTRAKLIALVAQRFVGACRAFGSGCAIGGRTRAKLIVVRLTVLGCVGSAPGPNSASSGYLIEAGATRVVVDLGNGTLAVLQGLRDPFALDAVLFSHLHPDHCADFSALTVLRRYHPTPSRDPRAHRLPVYGPSDAPGRFAAAYAPSVAEIAMTDLSDVYDFHPYEGSSATIGELTVTTAQVAHPCEAYGLRFEYGGRSLCYTGDSGPCDALVTLADGVDTLLAEASWTHADDRPPDLHLSGRQAGELAAKAGVGRLILTHILPWIDQDAVLAEATAAFPGEVLLARQAAEYEI